MCKPVFKAAVRQLPRMLLLTGAAWLSVVPPALSQDPLAGEMIDGSVMLGPGEVLMEPYGDPMGSMPLPGPMGYEAAHHGGGHSGGARHGGMGHHGVGHHGGALTGGLVSGPVTGDLCYGGCQPGYYVRAEALYMRRTGHEGMTLSQDFALDEFDFEIGPRLTLGRLFDCVNGYEFVYTGLFDKWDQAAALTAAAAGGPLNSRIFWFDPTVIPPDPLSAFSNADFQAQAYSVDYHSYEANRTYRGWDVVNMLIGGRVIDYSERYSYISQNNTPGNSRNGFLGTTTDNLLLGGQVGIDLAYPLGQRVWSTVRGRAGLFLNLADSQTIVVNDTDGTVNAADVLINNRDDDEDISGILEFGTGLRYRVAQRVWLTGGYEAIYLHDVATAPDQLYTAVSQGLGISTRIDDEVFIHGLTIGAEVFF